MVLVLAPTACDDGSAGAETEMVGSTSGESGASSSSSAPSTSGSSAATSMPGGSDSTTGMGPSGTSEGATTAEESSGSTDGGSTGEVELGEPVWMVVGNWGYRSWTRDGLSWDVEANPTQDTDHTPDLLRAVGWGNGYFIAVGGDANSMVMRSVDGEVWEEDLHPSGGQWKGGVAYGDGRWIAVGGVGTVIRSDDDGSTWVDHEERLPSAGRFVTHADGTFVAIGDNGMIAISEDGESWTDRTQAGAQLGSAAFGSGTWVAAGRRWNGSGFDASCFVSTDTETWTPCPFGGEYVGAFFADDRLFVALDSGYAVTEDGESWTVMDQSIPSALAFADGVWVGANGGRRYRGASLDALEEVLSDESGIRSFAMGYAP
ncbi:MAG: WD40/YVTN/BNR-like repeat-containing protein [Nannocystales bacterium]